jgi:hypothetical protein
MYDLYTSTNIILVIESRRIKWAGRVERMVVGRDGGAYKDLVWRPDGKRST